MNPQNEQNRPEDERTEPTGEQPPADEGTPAADQPPADGSSAAGSQPSADDSSASGPQAPADEEPTAHEKPTAHEEPTAQQPPTAEQPPAGEVPPAGPQAPSGHQPPPGQAPPAAGSVRRRLLRSRDDRVLGGVCGGLGRYFDTDPIFFRIGAIALAFLGGAGILLYLAALLLMPSDAGGSAAAGTTAPARNRGLVIAGVIGVLLITWPFLLGGGFILAWIGIPLALLVGAGVLVWWVVSGEGPSGDAGDIARRAALGIGVLILCGILGVAAAFGAAAGPDWLVPAVVVAAGVAIAVGAFVRPLRWLVLPAVTIALAGGVVAAAGIDLDGGFGDRDYYPASAGDLPDRYKLGGGELVVDLTDTDLPAGDVPLELDLGMGEARVIVPDDVCVATSADVGLGNVHVFGRDTWGADVDYNEVPEAPSDRTRLLIDAEVGVGEVRVHDPDAELRFRDDGWEHNDFDRSATDNAACSTTDQRANG